MIGSTLGYYRIESKLGEGGMGAVYRAEDTRLGRIVALKALLPERVAESQRLARFLQEARLASSLNHPNIATILDVGETDGLHYIAMEFVQGESLRRRIGQQPLKIAALLDLALQIADALAEAHSRGIIHRDIKGDNIMVTPQGRVKILDFGLAKRLPPPGDATETLANAHTEAGVIMGTVTYMSPEQALGQTLDARSDLFSFGVALYEMATGRLPFTGATATSVIDKILHQPPGPLGQFNAELPPAIEDLVQKLLEKSPDDRYQSAREVLVDLRRLKRALDAGALHRPRLRLASSRRGRLSWRHWLLFAAGLLAVGFGAFQVGRRLAAPRPAHATRFTAITNFAGVEAQPTFSPDGNSVAFVSDRGGQSDIWVSLVSAGSLVRVTNDSYLKSRPRWSPDGARIAYARLNEAGLWDVWIVPALGGTSRRILTNATDPAWSPDGHSLAYANMLTRTISIGDASGGKVRSVTQAEPALFHRQPAFSRSGRQIAVVRKSNGPYAELAVADLATGKLRSLTDDGALALSPAWYTADHWIYFASSRGGTLNIWRIAPTADPSVEPEQITAGQGDDAELDLSTDGQRIAFSSYRMNINLAEAPVGISGKLKWLTTDPARSELAPAYSHDGKRLAYFSNRKGIEHEAIWVADADGSHPVPAVEDDRANIFPRWAPDGQSLIYASHSFGRGTLLQWGTLEIWRAPLSGSALQKLTLTSGAGTAMWGDVGPDGRFVLVGPAGVLQLWDSRTGDTQKLPPTRGALFPRWSPDGRRIAYVLAAQFIGDPRAGAWIYDFDQPPRQIFSGWVLSLVWSDKDEIFIAEAKPDLSAQLWRVRLDGSSPIKANSLRSFYTYWNQQPQLRFDIHPDHRRMVVETVELHDADIGMIEYLR